MRKTNGKWLATPTLSAVERRVARAPPVDRARPAVLNRTVLRSNQITNFQRKSTRFV